jgi:hypothetical protein
MSAFQVIPFLTYIAVAHPATYKATRGVMGSWVASADGLATLKGVALHAVVFVLLATLLMRFVVPRVSGFGQALSGATFFGKGGETHRSGLGQMDDSPNIQGSPLQDVSQITNA